MWNNRINLLKVCSHQIDLSNNDMVSVNSADIIIVLLVLDRRDDNFEIDYIYHRLYNTKPSTFDLPAENETSSGCAIKNVTGRRTLVRDPGLVLTG